MARTLRRLPSPPGFLIWPPVNRRPQPAVEIMLGSKVAAHLELIGRKAYQELLALQAEVANFRRFRKIRARQANEA
jgi:hypothetical protein